MGIRTRHRLDGEPTWLTYYRGFFTSQSTCPGEKFGALTNDTSFCPEERWRITAEGKNCGDRIEHKDQVTLRALSTGSQVLVGWWRRFYRMAGPWAHDVWTVFRKLENMEP